jgi:hypothetical protein
MHPAYFETVFSVGSIPSRWPEQFAVITAFAPTGEKWPDEKNQSADSALESTLASRGVWKHRITGSSPDRLHSEPGWAAAIPLIDAKEIGTAFKQDAIYWIDGDEVFVTSCNERSGLSRIGSFAQRLHVLPISRRE